MVRVSLRGGIKDPLVWLSPCLLPWQRTSHTWEHSHSDKPQERTGSDSISKYISFPLVVCITSFNSVGLNNNGKIRYLIHLSILLYEKHV